MTLAYNRRKGAAAEVALEQWFLDRGYPAHRVHLNGTSDEGDVHIRHGWGIDVVEIKSAAALDIGAWLREVVREEANTSLRRPGVPTKGYVVVRPKGVTDPGQWWVVRRVLEVWPGQS